MPVPDWIVNFLSGLQRMAVSGLAAELRAGGMLTAVLAFALGALHALTPGHGKAALASYFLGQEAKFATGVRVALAASFIHVIMGALAFLVLRFIFTQSPLMTGRSSPFFAITGYSLILVAGTVMVIQSVRSMPTEARPHAITIGVGLLPCPLTISVLGFAWTQSTGAMVVVVLTALAAGIAFTIGTVALVSITLRRFFGHALSHRISGFERWARVSQGIAGAAIVIIAAYSIWTAL